MNPPSANSIPHTDSLRDCFTGKACLVTGGAGAIGSRLVKQLLCLGSHVTVLDDMSSGSIDLLPAHDNECLRLYKGSIVDESLLANVFEASRPNFVFHLAAAFANQNSVDNPLRDLNINGVGALKVLQHCKTFCCEKFVLASSSCVYGHNNYAAESQKASIAPETPYGFTKLLGEQYTMFFDLYHNLNTTIVRIYNSYGPGERPGRYRNVIPNFMQSAIRGESLTITGTGEETRDFNYVDNTIQGLLLAAAKSNTRSEIFNIGGGKETSINEVAALINKITRNRAPIRYNPRRNWDGVERRCANIEKAQRMLGYAPQNDIEAGLQETYNWFISANIVKY